MINKYLKSSLVIVTLFLGTLAINAQSMVIAADPCAGLTGNSLKTCRASESSSGSQAGSNPDLNTGQSPNADAQFKKSDCKGPSIKAGLPKDDPNHCGILDYLQIFINVLSALVGVVIVISIIVGGIQYSASGDDPQAVARAKSRIVNAILALILFIFSFAILQWLIPGGLF